MEDVPSRSSKPRLLERPFDAVQRSQVTWAPVRAPAGAQSVKQRARPACECHLCRYIACLSQAHTLTCTCGAAEPRDLDASSGAMGDPVDNTGDAHVEASNAEPPCKLEPVPAAAAGASHTPADAAAPAKASDQVPKTWSGARGGCCCITGIVGTAFGTRICMSTALRPGATPMN